VKLPPTVPAARLRAVAASAGMGALAGAGFMLLAVSGDGTATGSDVLGWAGAGLVLAIGVAVVCVEVIGRVRRWWPLVPLAMVTGLLLMEAWTLWDLRGDTESGDALLGLGVLGLLLGLIVGVTIRAVLGSSLRKRRAIQEA